MIRTFYVFAVCVLVVGVRCAVAQTADPQLSMYMFNPVYYNPAAAGSEGVSRFQVVQRTQYLGYQAIGSTDDAVQNTQLFSFNMPLAQIKSGVGVYAFNDRAAANINQTVQVSYAYRMTVKNGTLSLGVQGGLYNRGLDYSILRPGEPGDPLLTTGRVTSTRPDVGIGIYYNTTDYWIGASVRHLNQTDFTLGGVGSTYPLTRTGYLTAGYRLGVGYNLDVQPSVLIQYAPNDPFKQSNATFNVLATYENKYWAGVGYRTGDAAMATVGINLLRNNALRFGYNFDLVVGNPAAKAGTSHEILLAYALPAPDARRKPIVRTPRFRY